MLLNNHIDSRTNYLIKVSGIIGNLLEQYDVMVCAFLSHIISITFFPSDSQLTSLTNTFNVFLIGYLSRPIGSLIIGLYADQVGRKKAIIFSIIIAGISTSMIGLIPSYNELGICATIFFIIFRLLQNISAGGEYISSIVYVTESCSLENKGFNGSWVAFGLNAGTLIASIVVFLFTYLVEKKLIPEWSWRFIFLTSIVGMGVGLWVRYSLPESLEFILENSADKISTRWDILIAAFRLIQSYPGQCLAIFLITWLGVYTSFSVFIYAPIHMTTINNLSKHMALGINTFSLFVLIILIPIFGIFSDYVNKIKLLLASTIGIGLLSFPYFWYLSYGNCSLILFFKILFTIPCACFFTVAPVLISETFPLKVRCTTLALIYQVAASVAAGFTPLILIFLIKNTKLPYSPAYILILSSIMGILALRYLYKNPINFIKFSIEKVTSGSILIFPEKNKF